MTARRIGSWFEIEVVRLSTSESSAYDSKNKSEQDDPTCDLLSHTHRMRVSESEHVLITTTGLRHIIKSRMTSFLEQDDYEVFVQGQYRQNGFGSPSCTCTLKANQPFSMRVGWKVGIRDNNLIPMPHGRQHVQQVRAKQWINSLKQLVWPLDEFMAAWCHRQRSLDPFFDRQMGLRKLGSSRFTTRYLRTPTNTHDHMKKLPLPILAAGIHLKYFARNPQAPSL